ncbi:MAG: hypothetical protein IJZ70_08700 [Bacteroidales bacterium]|nr:hypothetical protein [Bacteroidales bacterium]
MKTIRITAIAFAALAVVSCGSFAKSASSVASTTAATATATSELIQNNNEKSDSAAEQVKAKTVGEITNATVENQAAYTSGQQTGVALGALHAQYKADGKVDMTNFTNILNVAIVANAAQTLKEQTEGGQYYKDFGKGLILGSNDLVSDATVGNVLAGISALSGVDVNSLQGKGDNAAAKGVEAMENVANIAASVSAIMTLFQ